MKLTIPLLIVFAALGAGCTTYFETPTSSTTTTTTPAADLNTFTSRVTRGGFAARSFTTAAAGTIQATLVHADPAVLVGLGVGIPNSDGGGCNVTRSVETWPESSPQITIAADAGIYCVKVYDLGHIEEAVSFTVTVMHP